VNTRPEPPARKLTSPTPSSAWLRWNFVSGALFVLTLCTSVAAEPSDSRATTPSPSDIRLSPRDLAAASADIVRLRDQSLYRGVIAELVKGSHVVIVTIAGDRFRFDWDAIEYAGHDESTSRVDCETATATSVQSTLAAQPALVPPKLISLDLRSRSKELKFMARRVDAPSQLSAPVVRLNSQAFGQLCDAPCRMQIEPGQYQIALSQHGASPKVAQPDLLAFNTSATLIGTFKSRAEIRTLGWLTLIVGQLVGGGLLLSGSSPDTRVAGGITSLITLPLGIVLAAQGNVSQVIVAPGLAPDGT